MFVLKFTVTAGFVELYFKSQEALDAAFNQYLLLNPKATKATIYIATDDYQRTCALPLSAILAAQSFNFNDELDAQVVIAQTRNDAQLREQQRMQQRASGLLVPGGVKIQPAH